MKTKLLCFSLLMLAMGGSLFAQRPVLIVGGVATANVADANDFQVILTANVTGVTLVSTTGTSSTPVTPATGYQITMRFVQDATGSRTVAFGGNITSSCTINATALSVTICRWQYTATGNTWADAGGGSSSASTFSVGTIDVTAAPYSAKFTVQRCNAPNLTITNGSNQVSCSTATFVNADIGSKIFATNWTVGNDALYINSDLILFVAGPTACFIKTIVNSTTVTAVTTSGGSTPCNATVTADSTHGTMFWGPDDTTQIAAGWAAASTGQVCRTLVLPSAMAFTSTGQFTTASCPVSGTGNSFYASVNGQGGSGGTSVLVPLPEFNYATCVGAGSNICFGGPRGVSLYQITIDGGGQRVGGTHAVTVFSATVDVTLENLMVNGWLTNSTNSIGFTWNGGYHITKNITIDGGGATSCQAGGLNQAAIYAIFCGNGVATPLVVQAGSTFAPDGIFLQNSGGSSFNAQNLGTLIITHGASQLGGSGLSHIFTPAGGITNVFESQFNASASGGTVFNTQGTGSVIAANNHILQSAAGASVWLCQSTSTCIDGGNNRYTIGGTFAGDTTTLTVLSPNFPNQWVQGKCTGVGTAASTLGLYGTGPNVTATTCTSATIGTGQVMQKAGTLYGLIATATAAGTNASSGVVTVLKNGAAQTITCTIGTGTNCSDLTHSVTYVRNDLISIQFTTQAADTLAGVSVMVPTT